MKLVIVSDNHGRRDVLKRIVGEHPDADAFLHAGDSEMPEDELRPFVSVTGNNDMYYPHPQLRVLEYDNFKVLLIHSHQFLMFKRAEKLVHKAHQLGCRIVVFGHTHVFEHTQISGVHLINPGSTYYNRDGKRPCYAVVTIENHGKDVTVVRVEL